MNNVTLVGRLTADPEVRYTSGDNGTAIVTFTIAVNRKFVNKNNPNAPTADFIRCQAFGQRAEFINNYFHKGNRIGITGWIQTGSYTNREGQKVYTTDVVVEEVEFVENKSGDASAAQTQTQNQTRTSAARGSGRTQSAPRDESWMNVPQGDNDDLPFN